MARVVAHNEGDFTAIVEPGLPFATLQSELAAKGQMLAIDPPADEATVGGVFATSDSGPLRHRYHAPRDLIIGVQLALADGSVARAGGTVIKNVAGYDLAKLFTGSFGTLGLMAEIAVRLHPLPQGTATAVGRSDDPAKLAAGAAACAREPLEADAFDVGGAAQGGAILVRLSGETASARVAKTLPLLADAGLVTSVEEDDDAIWARQREGQRSLRRGRGPGGRRPGVPAARARGGADGGRDARRQGRAGPVVAAPRPPVRRRRRRPRHRAARAARARLGDGHRRSGGRPRGRRSLGTGRPGPPRAHAQREGPLRPDRRVRPGLFVGGL